MKDYHNIIMLCNFVAPAREQWNDGTPQECAKIDALVCLLYHNIDWRDQNSAWAAPNIDGKWYNY